MADFVYNIAFGKVKYYCELPATNDALIVVPMESSGIPADATLRDFDDLLALLGSAANEQTTMGRKTISASVTVTVDDSGEKLDIDIPDQVWTAASGNAISDLTICYDNDTTTGTDSSIVPLTNHDFVITPDGSDVTAVVAAAGFFRAS